MVCEAKAEGESTERSLHPVQAFAAALLQPYTLDELLWSIADLVGERLGFDDCVIYLREGDALVQAAAYGVKNPEQREIMEPIIIPIGEGIVGTVALNGRAEYVPDIRADTRYISDQYAGASELAVPVCFEREVIGVFDSESATLDGYSELDRAHFQLFADIAAVRIAWFRSERARLSAAQHDSEHLESLGLLAGGIAHDFNNLMTVIALNVGELRWAEEGTESGVACPDEQEALDADRREALETIEQAVDRANGLTKQLVTFARGGAPIRKLVDPRPLLEESLRMLELGSTRLQWVLDLRGELPVINADPEQIAQVLRNLLINAREAMTDHGRVDHGRVDHGRVELRAQAHAWGGGLGLLVEVIDEGVGMEASVVSRVFDPYFSTKQRGSGLGLATSYWIAKRHGGALSCTSSPGQGSTFRLLLPALAGKLAPERAPAPLLGVDPLRLLMLEDDLLVGRGLEGLLSRHGHHVVWLVDGVGVAQAWTEAQALGQPYDLALLDLRNPKGMGGVEALAELLAVDPRARAIAMSGYTEGPGMRDYASLGFASRLEKPFDFKTLSATLREVLRV